MQTRVGDAGKDVHSIDDIYYFGGQSGNIIVEKFKDLLFIIDLHRFKNLYLIFKLNTPLAS